MFLTPVPPPPSPPHLPQTHTHVGLIFGGRDIDVRRHPYIFSLRNSGTGIHTCGAVLVHPAYALTAAHCIPDGRDLPHMWYLAQPCSHGAFGNGCREAGGTEGGVAMLRKLPVESGMRHPGWTGDFKDGADLAIVYLESPLEGHPTLRVLPQPGPAGWDENKKLYVLGWGLLDDDSGSMPRSLQGAELLYRSPRTCNDMYRKAGFGRQVINMDMICASADGAETCEGDSGGPLIIKGGSWEDDIGVGIVSFGNTFCGDPSDVPGVFTRLAAFTDYLEAARSEFAVKDPMQSPPPDSPPAPLPLRDEVPPGKLCLLILTLFDAFRISRTCWPFCTLFNLICDLLSQEVERQADAV